VIYIVNNIHETSKHVNEEKKSFKIQDSSIFQKIIFFLSFFPTHFSSTSFASHANLEILSLQVGPIGK
jgi:hypothetical protein